VTCRPTFGRLRNSTAFLVSGNSQPRRPAPPLRDREVAYLNPWPSIPRISKPDSSFPSVPFYDMYPSKRATAAYPEMPPWPCSKEPQQGPHVPPSFSRSSYLVARGSDSIMHIPRPPAHLPTRVVLVNNATLPVPFLTAVADAVARLRLRIGPLVPSCTANVQG
jgi:hypothetical protein